MLPVTFFHPASPGPEALKDVDYDEEWRSFLQQSRHFNWIVQTYARLRDAGYPVKLSSEVPEAGIVVFVAGGGSLRNFLPKYVESGGQATIVSINADAPRTFVADVEIVQNGYYADEETVFFIPYWPQPGLLPRDPKRGAQIRTVVYKGAPNNLHPAFRSEKWKSFLSSRDLRWVTDDDKDKSLANAWDDYSNADLIVAARPNMSRSYYRKPASKLVNAWLAGVPALLAPEYAYRELRRSDLDYIEIRSLDDAMAGIDRLMSDSDLYRAMIENGRRRAHQFTVEATTERWAEVLFEKVPALIVRKGLHEKSRKSIHLRRLVKLFRSPPHPWELRMWARNAKNRTMRAVGLQ